MSATENWCSWYGAYAFAFSSSLLFLFVTLLSYVFGPFDVDTMSSLCLLYFASSILNFVLFVVAGFELAAVSFFVLGSGLFYGAGAAATGLGGSYYFETFYTHEDQTFLFTKVCMLNAISTSLILLIVGCYVRPTVATFIGSAENIAFDRWIEKLDDQRC